MNRFVLVWPQTPFTYINFQNVPLTYPPRSGLTLLNTWSTNSHEYTATCVDQFHNFISLYDNVLYNYWKNDYEKVVLSTGSCGPLVLHLPANYSQSNVSMKPHKPLWTG